VKRRAGPLIEQPRLFPIHQTVTHGHVESTTTAAPDSRSIVRSLTSSLRQAILDLELAATVLARTMVLPGDPYAPDEAMERALVLVEWSIEALLDDAIERIEQAAA
jgi:hypothetical protein